MGAEEILRNPLNGEYISWMMKMAAETAMAQTINVTMTVPFGGAKRPKLMKMAASHDTTTMSNGMEMELLSDWRNSSHRLSRSSRDMARASERAAAC